MTTILLLVVVGLLVLVSVLAILLVRALRRYSSLYAFALYTAQQYRTLDELCAVYEDQYRSEHDQQIQAWGL